MLALGALAYRATACTGGVATSSSSDAAAAPDAAPSQAGAEPTCPLRVLGTFRDHRLVGIDEANVYLAFSQQQYQGGGSSSTTYASSTVVTVPRIASGAPVATSSASEYGSVVAIATASDGDGGTLTYELRNDWSSTHSMYGDTSSTSMALVRRGGSIAPQTWNIAGGPCYGASLYATRGGISFPVNVLNPDAGAVEAGAPPFYGAVMLESGDALSQLVALGRPLEQGCAVAADSLLYMRVESGAGGPALVRKALADGAELVLAPTVSAIGAADGTAVALEVDPHGDETVVAFDITTGAVTASVPVALAVPWVGVAGHHLYWSEQTRLHQLAADGSPTAVFDLGSYVVDAAAPPPATLRGPPVGDEHGTYVLAGDTLLELCTP